MKSISPAKPIPAGIYPFWFWNDTLTAAEIRWQIAEMHRHGIRGFFIHSRQGLGQPYLSEAFFELVDVAVAAAEKHGLLVHLYDEYPYPSGAAGGSVTIGHPEYQATTLVHFRQSVSGGPITLDLPEGDILLCRAYPRNNGKISWNRGRDLQKFIGPHFSALTFHRLGLTPYNRKRYLASTPLPTLAVTLPEDEWEIVATAQMTVADHKYWGNFPDMLRPEVVDRFIELTHEKYRARYGKKLGKSIVSIFVDETFPKWSPILPAKFQERYGYDLIESLPALAHTDHPRHAKVAHDFHHLLHDQFTQTFETKIRDWCHQNGLAYSGEKGSYRFSQLAFMDLPGCDVGHTKAGAELDLFEGIVRNNARATASAAYFYGKPGSLCECYHSLGWSATLQDAKVIADGLLFAGIDTLVPHGFFYSTHNLRKHDAPPSFFFQMPYWPFFGQFTQRIERILEHFSRTHLDAAILLIDPTAGIPNSEQRATYESLQKLLFSKQRGFHMVDLDLLESSQMTKGGELRLREITAKLLILPPMLQVEERLAAWLKKFQSKGGILFDCNRQPLNQLPAVLEKHVPPCLELEGDSASLLVAKRIGPQGALWFVLNPTDQPIVFCPTRRLEEIALDDTPLCERRTLAPFESIMLRESTAVSQPLQTITLPVPLACDFALANPNVARIDRWLMRIEGETKSAEVSTIPFYLQVEEGGLSLQPKIANEFGTPTELLFAGAKVEYVSEFTNSTTAPVELVIEPGSIVGEWELQINGHVIKERDLTSTHTGVRGSFGVDITRFVKKGRNELRVTCNITRLDGGLLNPLYLAGNFGVDIAPLQLVPLPKRGTFEAYRKNKIPYFSGRIDYRQTVRLSAIPVEAEIAIVLDHSIPFSEACEVSINGSDFISVLWEPRRFKIATKHLRKGANEIVTRVYTGLIRSFEGEWFDATAHQTRSVMDEPF